VGGFMFNKKEPETKEAPKAAVQTAPSGDLKQELDQKTKQAEDYLNTMKRLQADFENFIKRTDKERTEVVAFASAKLITKMLTVLDEFDHTLTSLKTHNATPEVIKGIELLRNNLYKVLTDEGITPIECKGKADPYQHEVILTEKNSAEDGTILQEIQKGYKLKDKVLRYAKVKVAKTGGN
jgi:molecular chaperone GrpE